MIIPLAFAALAATVVYYFFRLTRDRQYAGLPRIGKPGVIGYISSALRFILHAEECLDEGWKQFSGRPFVLPALGGPVVVLGPEHLERLRVSNDMIVSRLEDWYRFSQSYCPEV